MMPDPRMGLSTQRPEISVLRADTAIMTYKPFDPTEEPRASSELSKEMTMKVGGALGMGST